MKKFLKEYWIFIVMGCFASFLSNELNTITKIIYTLILGVFLQSINYFIVRKIFFNTKKIKKK